MNQDSSDLISKKTEDVMQRFNNAFLRHDAVALLDLVGEDCVIESTRPAPNGLIHAGRKECLVVWQGVAAEPSTQFELEETSVAGERPFVRWRYRWGNDESQSIRGVNLMRVRQGRITEAMGYVKGQ